MTCETCGRPLAVGQWPWCPHGIPSGGIQPDTFSASGMWIENLSSNGHAPMWVEGRADLKRKAAAQGLRWVPEGVTGVKSVKRDDDMKGRHNGGAFPTFRTHARPDTSGGEPTR